MLVLPLVGRHDVVRVVRVDGAVVTHGDLRVMRVFDRFAVLVELGIHVHDFLNVDGRAIRLHLFEVDLIPGFLPRFVLVGHARVCLLAERRELAHLFGGDRLGRHELRGEPLGDRDGVVLHFLVEVDVGDGDDRHFAEILCHGEFLSYLYSPFEEVDGLLVRSVWHGVGVLLPTPPCVDRHVQKLRAFLL